MFLLSILILEISVAVLGYVYQTQVCNNILNFYWWNFYFFLIGPLPTKNLQIF